MFRHDRRELEGLAIALDHERARVAESRVRLARAGRRTFERKLALLWPLTAGALVGALALHREPRGGRFSVKELFASTTALTGLVETFRGTWMPLLTDAVRAGAEAVGETPKGDAP